jgi:tetratricopeptide (TPR) repeat protein
MKKISVVFYSFVVILISLANAFSQDMNPEAGKLYNEGNKMLKAGNFDGALQQYNQALNFEKDYRIYYQKGLALKSLGKNNDAKNAFEEALKLKPGFEAGYNALGGVDFATGNYQGAITNFEKVLEVSKNNSVKNKVKKNLSLAYTKLGNDAATSGNTSKAIENLTKGAEYSNYDAAYLSLAKLYSELGQWDKTISASENALKYKSSIGKGGPYYYMGLAYKGKNDLAKAKEMFNNAKNDATYKKTAEYELSLLK